jgi:hypothetical protein
MTVFSTKTLRIMILSSIMQQNSKNNGYSLNMLSLIILSVIILSLNMLSAIMVSVIILSLNMLSVIMVSVIILRVNMTRVIIMIFSMSSIVKWRIGVLGVVMLIVVQLWRVVMQSAIKAYYQFAECHYAGNSYTKSHYVECYICVNKKSVIILSVIILSVIILSVIKPSVIILSAIR